MLETRLQTETLVRRLNWVKLEPSKFHLHCTGFANVFWLGKHWCSIYEIEIREYSVLVYEKVSPYIGNRIFSIRITLVFLYTRTTFIFYRQAERFTISSTYESEYPNTNQSRRRNIFFLHLHYSKREIIICRQRKIVFYVSPYNARQSWRLPSARFFENNTNRKFIVHFPHVCRINVTYQHLASSELLSQQSEMPPVKPSESLSGIKSIWRTRSKTKPGPKSSPSDGKSLLTNTWRGGLRFVNIKYTLAGSFDEGAAGKCCTFSPHRLRVHISVSRWTNHIKCSRRCVVKHQCVLRIMEMYKLYVIVSSFDSLLSLTINNSTRSW